MTIDRMGLTLCRYGKGGTIELPGRLKPMTMAQYQATFQWWFHTPDVRIQAGTTCWTFDVKKMDIENSDAIGFEDFYGAHHLFRPFPVKRNKKRRSPKRKRKNTRPTGQPAISEFFRPAKRARHNSDSF